MPVKEKQRAGDALESCRFAANLSGSLPEIIRVFHHNKVSAPARGEKHSLQ